MKCHQVEELLEQFLDQELDLKLRSAVENHLLSCTSCSGKLADISMTRELVRDLEAAELPSGLHQRIMASVYETLERQQSETVALPAVKRGISASERALLYEAGRASSKRATPVWMRGIALAAVAAVLIISGKQWVDQGRSGIASQGEDVTSSTPYAVYGSTATGGIAYDPLSTLSVMSVYGSIPEGAPVINTGETNISSDEITVSPEEAAAQGHEADEIIVMAEGAEVQEQEADLVMELPIETAMSDVVLEEPSASPEENEAAKQKNILPESEASLVADGAFATGAATQSIDVTLSMFSYSGGIAEAARDFQAIDEALSEEAMSVVTTANEAARSLSLQDGTPKARVNIYAALPETRPVSDMETSAKPSEFSVVSQGALPRMLTTDQADVPSTGVVSQPGQWILLLPREVLDAEQVEVAAHKQNCLNWVSTTNDEELILYGSMRNLQQVLNELKLTEPVWSRDAEQRDWQRSLSQEGDRWFFLSLLLVDSQP